MQFLKSFCYSDFWAIWSCGACSTAPWSWDRTLQGFWVCSSQYKF